MRIRDVVLKTYLGRWTIGRSGERGSGISVLPARYDDDDDIFHSQGRAVDGIGLHVNADKTEYMCFNQRVDISTQNGNSQKLEDKFIYLGSSVSSTETDINTRLAKAWTANDRLSVIWMSDLTDEIKRSCIQAVVVSILLYGCTTWTLTKRLKKNLDGIYTRMQRLTKQQLYGHLPTITKSIQLRRTRHAGH